MEFPKTKTGIETTNPIYKKFFFKSNLEARVEQTKWHGQYSKNSFCFINPEVKSKQREKDVLETLQKVFDIQSDSFKPKIRN